MTKYCLIEDSPAEQAEFMARFERKQAERASRADIATSNATRALARLIDLAETRDSGQIQCIALFLGAVWNGARHFDLYELRGLDVEISDDMLAVLDGLRWKRLEIGDMVPNGDRRIEGILTAWGMFGADQTGQIIAVR
jgi:hypothetical protein